MKDLHSSCVCFSKLTLFLRAFVGLSDTELVEDFDRRPTPIAECLPMTLRYATGVLELNYLPG